VLLSWYVSVGVLEGQELNGTQESSSGWVLPQWQDLPHMVGPVWLVILTHQSGGHSRCPYPTLGRCVFLWMNRKAMFVDCQWSSVTAEGIRFFFFSFTLLGFELRASRLLSRCSATYAISLVLFCVRYFWDRFLWTICPGWPQTANLQISASYVARIIGVSHWCPAGDRFSQKNHHVCQMSDSPAFHVLCVSHCEPCWCVCLFGFPTHAHPPWSQCLVLRIQSAVEGLPDLTLTMWVQEGKDSPAFQWMAPSSIWWSST
jgi:hypothetical protein